MTSLEMNSGRLRVYFTIDTETSMGGAWRNPAFQPLPLDTMIFGKREGEALGIPLMMDILEEHGFRGTFFTEVFCGYIVGFDPLQQVFDAVQQRGHDIQLHLHPIYRFYHDRLAGRPGREMDLIFRLSDVEQQEMIADGVALFRRLARKAPRAFRAGCYGGSRAMLSALRRNGIVIDSSYNPAYMGPERYDHQAAVNRSVWIDGVYEAPVTVFRGVGSGHKPLEISAVSVGEILSTLKQMRRSGCADAVLVLHSFSFLKARQSRYREFSVNRVAVSRFRRLCRALARQAEDFEVCPLGEAPLPEPAPAAAPELVPSVGPWRPTIRKFVQGVNRLPWL